MDDDFPSTFLASTRLARLPTFSEQDYLRRNPDVAQAGMGAARHALLHGLRDRRRLFSNTAIARAYGVVAGTGGEDAATAAAAEVPRLARPRRCSILVHSLSDGAHHETAAALASDLERIGFEAHLLDETADRAADHGIVVVVAAHEFFTLGLGPLWWERGLLADSFVLNSHPLERLESGTGLTAILNARGVLETSAACEGLWREAGIPTLRIEPRVRLRHNWLAPGDLAHPLVLAAPARARTLSCDPLPWRGRPLDLLFFGVDTERRNAVFGAQASSFAKHSTYLYLQQAVIDKVEEWLHRRAHSRIFGHLATQAKITLNVSEGRFPTFDRSHLLDRAMAGGSLVVSDVTFVDPTVQAGTHYLHDDPKHIGALIDWLISDEDGRRAAERVREAAFSLIEAINRDPGRLARLAAFLTADPPGTVEPPR